MALDILILVAYYRLSKKLSSKAKKLVTQVLQAGGKADLDRFEDTGRDYFDYESEQKSLSNRKESFVS